MEYIDCKILFCTYFFKKQFEFEYEAYSDYTMFCIQNGNWLNYVVSSDLLLSHEVECLNKNLEELLSGNITTYKELEFTEPDISLVFNPKKEFDVNDINPNYEHKFDDIFAEFHIHLWDSVLTDNYISLCLVRENIEAIVSCLDSVTK